MWVLFYNDLWKYTSSGEELSSGFFFPGQSTYYFVSLSAPEVTSSSVKVVV